MTKFLQVKVNGEMDLNACESAVADFVRVINMGGVVLHPTETCYGLAVSALNKDAIDKIYRIKGRDFKKPLSICVADVDMAFKYGEFHSKLLELANEYWPGPLSVLVDRGELLPRFLNPSEEKVSMRVPGNEIFRKVIAKIDAPVVSTSANVAGGKEIYRAEIDVFPEEVRGLIDLVIDCGEIPANKPSTIVGVDEMGHLKIVREGEIRFS